MVVHIITSIIQLKMYYTISNDGVERYIIAILFIGLMCAYAPISYWLYRFVDTLCRSDVHHAVKLGKTPKWFFGIGVSLQTVLFAVLF